MVFAFVPSVWTGSEHAGEGGSAASAAPCPAKVRSGRAAVTSAATHQRASAPPSPLGAVSSTHASRASSPTYSIFTDHPYSGPVPANPVQSASSQHPLAVGSYEAATYSGVSQQVYADNVFPTVEREHAKSAAMSAARVVSVTYNVSSVQVVLLRRVSPLHKVFLQCTMFQLRGMGLLLTASLPRSPPL